MKRRDPEQPTKWKGIPYRRDPKTDVDLGVGVVSTPPDSGQECYEYKYYEIHESEHWRETGEYNFWRDAGVQLLSLGKENYRPSITEYWYQWKVEWHENSCEPGVKYDVYTHAADKKSKVIREEGVYPTRLPEGYPDRISIGGVVGSGKQKGVYIGPGTGSPISPDDTEEKVKSAGQHLVDNFPSNPLPTGDDLMVTTDLYNRLDQIQKDKSPDVSINMEGYVTQSSDDPTRLRTSSWMSNEWVNPLNTQMTGKQIKDTFKTAYIYKGGDRMSNFKDDAIYECVGVSNEEPYSTYDISGDWHDIKDDSDVTIKVKYGTYLVMWKEVK